MGVAIVAYSRQFGLDAFLDRTVFRGFKQPT
jgi:hypothetical protein